MKQLQITDNELAAALRRMAPEAGALICMGCGYEHGCSVHGCAILRTAADRLTGLFAPPPNPPLTLEELREMDGEPVWISAYGINRYDVFTGFANDEVAQFYREALPLRCYGDTWLAYRRKPEEGKK